MPEAMIPRKLLPFLEKKKRYKIAIGGRGGAKSQSFCDMLIMKVQTEQLKVGCFREFQNSIDDSVYSLLESEVERLQVQNFTSIKNQIHCTTGGAFRFKGLARNVQSVKSMHGFDVFWIEEAQTLSDQSIKTVGPTLRSEDSEIWMSANPISSMDPFSKRFIEPYKVELHRFGFYEDDQHLIVQINFDDNPWFPNVLENERLDDFERLSRAEYDHIWLGKYNDTVEAAIIKPEWFDAAIDAHKKLGFEPLGCKVVSHDPSDMGPDDKGLCVRHGSVVLDCDLLTTGDVNEGMDWATSRAIEEKADLFVWDCDGMGASLRRQANEALIGKKIDLHEFKGSEEPSDSNEIYQDAGDNQKRRTNKQTFKNERAKRAWELRDRFYKTWLAVEKRQYIDRDELISISSGVTRLEQLRSETCRIPRKHNANGLIQIMSKPEMKMLRIESPNLFDALMMSQVSTMPATEFVNINFASEWD